VAADLSSAPVAFESSSPPWVPGIVGIDILHVCWCLSSLTPAAIAVTLSSYLSLLLLTEIHPSFSFPAISKKIE
jgi:hypothetical protein